MYSVAYQMLLSMGYIPKFNLIKAACIKGLVTRMRLTAGDRDLSTFYGLIKILLKIVSLATIECLLYGVTKQPCIDVCFLCFIIVHLREFIHPKEHQLCIQVESVDLIIHIQCICKPSEAVCGGLLPNIETLYVLRAFGNLQKHERLHTASVQVVTTELGRCGFLSHFPEEQENERQRLT